MDFKQEGTLVMTSNDLITSNVVCDSIWANHRLTTLEVQAPLHVHVHHLRHRCFSFSVQSSRAIPTKRLLGRSGFVPTFWGKNKGGMSPDGIELRGIKLVAAKMIWKSSMLSAELHARMLAGLGLHKETANRVLSPYINVKYIVTATDWDNFFELRCHPAAQQDMQDLAYKMAYSLNHSKPVTRLAHIPYATEEECKTVERNVREHSMIGPDRYSVFASSSTDSDNDILIAAAARCARVSYLTHNGSRDFVRDIALGTSLKADKHMSPFEHIAIASGDDARFANFTGWRQFRHYIEREQV